MAAVPKPSFNTSTFPFQQQQKVNFDDLPPDIKQQLANAYSVQTQQQQGWSPSKAPTINIQQGNVPGTINTNIPFPGPQPAQPQPQQAQMPQYVQQQFWSPSNQQPQQQQVVQPQPQVQHQAKAHVAFLICSHGQVDARFAQVMMRLPVLAAVANCDWSYYVGWKYGLAETRMRLLLDAMNAGNVTHICYLDSDIIPEGDDAIQLLLSNNLPLVSGIYWNTLGSGFAAWVDGMTIGPEQPAPVVPVHQVGMGFCLIQTGVFQALKQQGAPWPWFYLHIDPNNPRTEYGEDFFFENLCAQIGIKPHVDFRVKCNHIKSIMYKWNGEVV